MTERAFYTVADTRFFLGLVGLVNSLRSQGHGERIVIVDCGLTAAEREALSAEITIIEPPEETSPMLAWAFEPLQSRLRR